MVVYSTYASGKFASSHALLCQPFDETNVIHATAWAFYYSKYWEWLDTMFMILAKKPVSWLQYTTGYTP